MPSSFYLMDAARAGFLLESSSQLLSWMAPSGPEDFRLNAISSERPLRRILINPLLSVGLYQGTICILHNTFHDLNFLFSYFLFLSFF